MQLKQARLIMEAAEAKSKAAAATTTVLPESEGKADALEALANDGLQFICMFETDDDNNSSVDEANNCKLCKAPPYGGACTGECMDV
jgi:hypothetical protein